MSPGPIGASEGAASETDSETCRCLTVDDVVRLEDGRGCRGCGELDPGFRANGHETFTEGFEATLYSAFFVATRDELLEALEDYARRCNANVRLRAMLGDWSCRMHCVATDITERFTVLIQRGVIASPAVGAVGEPDLVITGSSEDLCDMFWGDVDPAAMYVNGEITVQGSAENLLRIDAIATLIWAS